MPSEEHIFLSRSFARCAGMQVYLWDKVLVVGIECIFFTSVNNVNQLPKRLHQNTILEEVKVLPTTGLHFNMERKKIDF